MSLSIYVHIPYCVQRCRYCDFTTFEQSQIMPPQNYVDLVRREIRERSASIPYKTISTLYFGGGTPSLLDPGLIVSIIAELANEGFRFNSDVEMTIEINPATIDQKKLDSYKKAGFNRFSVGAQSFKEHLLQVCGRRHTANDTRKTLELLCKEQRNVSFDLLFALPGQTLEDLRSDLSEALSFNTQHMSLYYLTVPEGHPMATGRPAEDDQLEMFDIIDQELVLAGFKKYEISNYARPGFESKHNLSYWNHGHYWGLGLSAHSYLDTLGHGFRFWNPKSFAEYESQLTQPFHSFAESLPAIQREHLTERESLTDFCHMAFRQPRGLSKDAAQKRFAPPLVNELCERLEGLKMKGWAFETPQFWQMSPAGELLLNQALLDLCFVDS